MKTDIEDALHALVQSAQGRKVTGLLRAHLPAILAAKRAGSTDSAIVAALKEAGVEVSLSGFRSALFRLRKEAKEVGADPDSVQDPILNAGRIPVATERHRAKQTIGDTSSGAGKSPMERVLSKPIEKFSFKNNLENQK